MITFFLGHWTGERHERRRECHGSIDFPIAPKGSIHNRFAFWKSRGLRNTIFAQLDDRSPDSRTGNQHISEQLVRFRAFHYYLIEFCFILFLRHWFRYTQSRTIIRENRFIVEHVDSSIKIKYIYYLFVFKFLANLNLKKVKVSWCGRLNLDGHFDYPTPIYFLF
jgi:hypothetical protein